MAFPSHHRNHSPAGMSPFVAGPRASTGMVQLGSSVDPYEQPMRYYEYADYPSDAGYASTAYRHYPSHHSPVEARPISTQHLRDPGQSVKKRTEYAIEPQHGHRSRSNTASAVDIYQNGARLSVSTHHGPAIHSGYGRAASPLAASSGHYVTPASSNYNGRHRRVYSTDYASDTGRLASHNRVKHRSGPRTHHAPPSRQHRVYDNKKGNEIDTHNAYSYTTPREQFDRDYPVDPRPRHPSGRTPHERPMSMTATELAAWTHHREGPSRPHLTGREHERLAREEQPRSARPVHDEYLSRELSNIKQPLRELPNMRLGPNRSQTVHDEYPSRELSNIKQPYRELPNMRGGPDRPQVVAPRGSDDGSESFGDTHRNRHRRDYGSHHEGDRARHDDRHDDDRHDDRPSRAHHNGVNEGALVGLGTATLGHDYSDMSNYDDYRPASRQHRRPRDPKRNYNATESTSRELIEGVPSGPGNDKQLYLEPADHDRQRRHHRSPSKRHPRAGHASDSDGFTDDEDLRRYQREPSAAPHHKNSSEDQSDDNHTAIRRRPPRERSHVRSRSRSRSSDDDSKNGGRNVVAVDPRPHKDLEVKPKGILKKPRTSFPEEPNPVREGVAPLKDADNSGVPPGARWTKIDRRLVNPSALRLAGERFEEREDYVIVLKVLSVEKIEELAAATRAIRDARSKESVRDRRQRRDEHRRDGHHYDSSSSDDEDEDDHDHRHESLQIEAPPMPGAFDLPERPRQQK
ncbi:hypothetical protein N7540_007462 [Penicillium herquei]|nr:hypothetical protein N7540_007462 [Penicillium herquei]